MIFIDASAYLSALLPNDPNREKAVEILQSFAANQDQLMTSYAILGEVFTVSSQRYDRQKGIRFVKQIIQGQITLVLETDELIDKTFKIFYQIKDKDVSWVDCYSFAIIETYKVETVFSFDHHFKKYINAKVLG